MINVDASTVTMEDLEDKVLTIIQDVDQVLSNGSSTPSSTFMSFMSPNDIDTSLIM